MKPICICCPAASRAEYRVRISMTGNKKKTRERMTWIPLPWTSQLTVNHLYPPSVLQCYTRVLYLGGDGLVNPRVFKTEVEHGPSALVSGSVPAKNKNSLLLLLLRYSLMAKKTHHIRRILGYFLYRHLNSLPLRSHFQLDRILITVSN